MKQEFHGPIAGGVSGRDIIHCHGGPECPLHGQPESEMQAKFHRNTGIWCPRPVRDAMERLMSEYGFTAKELRHAWDQHSITTDSERQQIKFVTPWFEAAFGWFVLIVVSLYFLAVALPLVWNGGKHDWRVPVTLVGGSVVYFLILFFTARSTVVPRRIALRAKRKLGEEDET